MLGRRRLSSVLKRYRSNYDKIAADHVRYWRETGGNPFQGAEHIKANEDATAALIDYYAPKGYWLDAGCGMGDLLMRLPNRERVGVDISLEYLKIAEQRGLEVELSPVEKMPFHEGTFDLVTATDILEHVLDLNRAVKELLRVLKPGGTLIVRTPNEEALSRSSDPYEYVHLRRFDAATMFLLFTKIFGCEVLATPVDGEVLHAVVRK